MAACLWGGPTAVASHRAAGHLWNLAGVEPGFIEIVVDRCLRSESVIVHRLPAPPQWILHRDSIPVCDPTTTIFQLAAVLPPFRLEVALDCAMRLKLTHVGILNDHLDRAARRGRNRISIIRRLLAERDPDVALTASTLEDLLSRLIRKYGLPRPVPHFSVFDERGRFVARPDFAYPRAKLVVGSAELRLSSRPPTMGEGPEAAQFFGGPWMACHLRNCPSDAATARSRCRSNPFSTARHPRVIVLSAAGRDYSLELHSEYAVVLKGTGSCR
jgi:hypothetical protein